MTRVLDLAWTADGGRTSFRRHRYRWPYVVHRLFHPDPADPTRALTLVQSSGAGLQPGDHLRVGLQADPGVHTEVRGQGATYVSGTPEGAPAQEHLTVEVAQGSAVVVDLAPRILTRHAHLVQDTDLIVAPGGAAAVVESFVIHPEAAGTTELTYDASTRVFVAGEHDPVAIERQSLDGVHLLPSALGAFATVLVAAPGHLPCPGCEVLLARAARTPHAYAAASELPGGAGLVARLAARDGLLLRRGLADVTTALEEIVRHVREPATVPRKELMTS